MKGWGLSSSFKGPALLVPVGCREVELQSQPANDSENILVSLLGPSLASLYPLFSLPALSALAKGGEVEEEPPRSLFV
jgi:hypothetical protein